MRKYLPYIFHFIPILLIMIFILTISFVLGDIKEDIKEGCFYLYPSEIIIDLENERKLDINEYNRIKSDREFLVKCIKEDQWKIIKDQYRNLYHRPISVNYLKNNIFGNIKWQHKNYHDGICLCFEEFVNIPVISNYELQQIEFLIKL